MMKKRNVLTLAHLHRLHTKHNRIFEDWCDGIRANSGDYHFIDYVELYSDVGKKAFEKQVEKLIIERNINYIFLALYSGDLTLDSNFLRRLSELSFLVINFFDTEHYFEPVDRYYAQAADLVLLPDYLSKFRYELLNISALCTFSLFNKDNYRRSDAAKSIDVSFVGDVAKGERREYIDYLLKNQILLECYGNNTENGLIGFDRMVEIFNRSRININFTGVVDNASLILGSKINNRIRQSKGRPIEIALSGGFILTEYAPGIEHMFEIGKEMDVFRTREELQEKIKYYLVHEKEREEVAQRGYERAIRDYDSKAAFSRVFEAIKNYKKAESVIYLDKAFIRDYSSYRFVYIVRFLIRGKIKGLLEELGIILRNGKISFCTAYKYAVREIMEIAAYFLRNIKAQA